MPTLGDHRANFTWALNKYNKSDDPDDQEKFARYLAKYIAQGLHAGFTLEQVTQEKSYPVTEVNKYSGNAESEPTPVFTEEQAKKEIAETVDTADVVRLGNGQGTVYAYGYRCCPDRLKVGYTEGEAVQRIADQIFTSTPDRPVLFIEIRSDKCRALERAIQTVLEVRGRKIVGGGDEWFKVTRNEVLDIYKFVIASEP